jgi:hypothetical protein
MEQKEQLFSTSQLNNRLENKVLWTSLTLSSSPKPKCFWE